MNITPVDERVIVAGDWHGNISWASHVLRVAEKMPIDTIIQCGDFGYWEHTPAGVYYLDTLSENANRRGVNVVWLDGNHENHDMLHDAYRDSPVTDEGFIQIRPNVFYSPRGNVWEWHGQRFMTVGGAVSIDKEFRKIGESWWAGETLTEEDVVRSQGVGRVDYLFSHDGPTTYPAPLWKQDPDSEFHRRQMNRIANAVKPSRWFHGHYHKRVSYRYPEYDSFCKVECLDCDESHDNMLILDYGNLAVYTVYKAF